MEALQIKDRLRFLAQHQALELSFLFCLGRFLRRSSISALGVDSPTGSGLSPRHRTGSAGVMRWRGESRRREVSEATLMRRGVAERVSGEDGNAGGRLREIRGIRGA